MSFVANHYYGTPEQANQFVVLVMRLRYKLNHGAIAPYLVWDLPSTKSREAFVRSSVAGTCYSLYRCVYDPPRKSSLCLAVDGGNSVALRAVAVSTTEILSRGSRVFEVGRHDYKVYEWGSYHGRASVYHLTVHMKSWRCCCSHGREQVFIRVVEANNFAVNRRSAAISTSRSDGDPTVATCNGGPAYNKASSASCLTG
jgi:hypothetical protein